MKRSLQGMGTLDAFRGRSAVTTHNCRSVRAALDPSPRPGDAGRAVRITASAPSTGSLPGRGRETSQGARQRDSTDRHADPVRGIAVRRDPTSTGAADPRCREASPTASAPTVSSAGHREGEHDGLPPRSRGPDRDPGC